MDAKPDLLAVRSLREGIDSGKGYIFIEPDLANLDMNNPFDVLVANAKNRGDWEQIDKLMTLFCNKCPVFKRQYCTGFKKSQKLLSRQNEPVYFATATVHIRSPLTELAGKELQTQYTQMQILSLCEFPRLEYLESRVIHLITNISQTRTTRLK